MKYSLIAAAALLCCSSNLASATKADATSVVMKGHAPGASPFIAKVTLGVSDLAALTRIRFSIAPKPGSVSRPLVATYTRQYLANHGYVTSSTSDVAVPVFGLYAGYTNAVTLTYFFTDGSSKQGHLSISTARFNDACEFNTPQVVQPRTSSTDLSYDFILVGSNCGPNSPTIIDTDGAVRWVGTAGVQNKTCWFFANAVYQADGPKLLRNELDGRVTLLADYSSLGVTNFHHNIDPGKFGLLLGVNTTDFTQTVILDVDRHGKVFKQWNMAEVIRKAMTAGGDDPAGFVYPHSESWFHNNSAIYRRADDSLIISSRENFVICIDYNSGAIKWILGDKSKKWYQYRSLAKYALDLTEGVAPIGQHAVSIGKDRTLLLMDNGAGSIRQTPAGNSRNFAAARKYRLDPESGTATEVWNFVNDKSIHSPYCSSVYEDAPGNYVVDYAPGFPGYARILGLTPAGDKAFEYAYPTQKCEDAYRSMPLPWRNLTFPPSAANTANAEAEADDIANFE